MDRVRMEHPKLPGRHIMVRPAAVTAHERAGWQVVEAKPARRRRVTTEESEHDNAADRD